MSFLLGVMAGIAKVAVMTHHYTKNTEEASYFCRVCNRVTMHRIDSGRLGPCLECTKELKPAKPIVFLDKDLWGNPFK